MDGLTALLLATPLLGMSLTPAAGAHTPSIVSPSSQPVLSTRYLLLEEAEAEAEAAANEAGETTEEAEEAEGSDGGDRLERARRRARLVSAHRGLGIATWASMTATLVFGALQYADSYVFDDDGGNRCSRGEPIMGSWNCDFPVMHLSFAFLTAALYGTTFGVSIAMRDDELSNAEGSRGSRLRMHRILRWIHLAGIAFQIVEGIIMANVDFEDTGTAQAVASVHLGVGGLTWAVLTWAGAMMLAR